MSPLPKIDANIILKLPLWQRLLILVFLWLIIIGAFYYFLYSGKLAEKKALTTKLEGLKNTAAEKQRIASNLPKFRQEHEELNKEFQKALLQLPNEKEIANLLENISEAARSARLDILTFKPGKETPKGFYAEVTIDMKVEGAYASIMTFFEKVAALPRIVNMGGLNIAGGAKEVRGEAVLAATFVATTFKFVPQPEVKPEAKKK